MLDPACGDGAFLLAAADWLEARGLSRSEIVTRCLYGQDLDPQAAAAATAALVAWVATADPAGVRPNIAVGDALDGRPVAGCGPVDLVIGNPPFLQQLAAATARARPAADALRARWGAASAGYADTAAVFLAAALGWCRPGGRVGLILPESVLASRDAAGARAAVLAAGGLAGLWWAGEQFFDAGVEVCAVVAGPGTAPARVRRAVGRQVRAVGPVPPPEPGRPWASLVADLRGVPPVTLADGPALGDRWTTTAGFRDEYYGVAPFVGEAPPGPLAPHLRPLVTSGLVDPAHLRWGATPARFARRSWRRPVVDGAALAAQAPPTLARWAQGVLVPKVLVATQTRVLEAVVDTDGRCWPSVPTLAVQAPPAELWHAAAVLMAPPVTAWALAAFGGTALHRDALKVSAAQLRGVRLPADRRAWDAGADAARRAQEASAAGEGTAWRQALGELGAAMTDAYGAPASVASWWEARLPPWRGSAPGTDGDGTVRA